MEILNNSIIKLIVRQGSDLDRKQVVLASGELGFTTDQERLFVGNGYDLGGVITGTKFKGVANLITDGSIQPAIPGDLGYSSQNRTLYALSANTGSSIEDWHPIGGVYTNSQFITISSGNMVVLNPLSAYSISSDLLYEPFTLSGGKIALGEIGSYHISVSAVQYPIVINQGKIALSAIPNGHLADSAVTFPLSVVEGVLSLMPLSSYSVSQQALSSPLYIREGKITLGDIPTSLVSNKTITIGSGLAAVVNGVASTGVNISPLTNNITINSNQILLKYNALSGSGSYSRNATTYTTISAGHYRVTFAPITTEYIPIVNIVGVDALGYQARVIAAELSSCDIKILDSAGASRDANIYLTINF